MKQQEMKNLKNFGNTLLMVKISFIFSFHQSFFNKLSNPMSISINLKNTLNNTSPLPPISPRKTKTKIPLIVVILIGGPSKGTRFRPLTFEQPKPLFPIAGKPMIAHHIEAVQKIQTESDDYYIKVYLLGSFKKDLVQGFCDAWFKAYDQEITYLEEPTEYLGTAGGLIYFEKKILQDTPTETKVLVMNGDICSSFPLIQLIKLHESNSKKGAICTMMATTVPQKESNNYGCLVLGDYGQVVHYVEKPQSYINDIVNCGIYLFESQMFKQMAKTNQNEELKHISLEKEILTPLVEKNCLYAYLISEKETWQQIKTASAALHCTNIYLKQRKSTHKNNFKFTVVGEVEIHHSAEIHSSAKIGPNVTIGENVKIGKGVRVSNSIILDGVIIKEFALVTNSIVGWRSSIGKWSRVEGHMSSSHHDVLSENEEKVCLLGSDVSVDNEILLRDSIVLPHKNISMNISNRIIL